MWKGLKAALMVSALPFAMGTALADEPSLGKDAKEASAKIYFQPCAGCPGLLRKGATG